MKTRHVLNALVTMCCFGFWNTDAQCQTTAPRADAPKAQQTPTVQPSAPPGARPGMIFIPTTDFFMGFTPDVGGMEPGHIQHVEAFYIDALETTVSEYVECVHAGRCQLPNDRNRACNLSRRKADKRRARHPVNCIVYDAAVAYCQFRGKRLPTTAEWQLAARGTDRRLYPWGNEEPGEQLCWQGRRGFDHATTCPVGSFPGGKSPFGVLDMSGNVAEWTSSVGGDIHDRDRVVEGGSYLLDPLEVDWWRARIDMGGGFPIGVAEPENGIRCAQSVRP
jgi:formylglycine-generating enzyme required for sulfatase activity